MPDEWTFTIRQGVLWQDGTPLTVDDVVASFDRITDPKVGSAALSAFAGVLSNGNIEKVDDQTVKFHLDRAYGGLPDAGVVLQLQLRDPAEGLQGGDVHEGRDRHRAVHPEDVLGRPGRELRQEPEVLGRPHAALPGRRPDQVLRGHAADRAGHPGRLHRRVPAGSLPGLAGAVLGRQHPRQRDAVERVPHAADAGRPGALEGEGGAPGAGVLARPAGPRPGPAGRQGRARQRPRVRAHLSGIADLRGGAAAGAGHRQGQAAAADRRDDLGQRHAHHRAVPGDPAVRPVREADGGAGRVQHHAGRPAADEVLRHRRQPAVAAGQLRHHRLGRPRRRRPDHRPGLPVQLGAKARPVERRRMELRALVRSAVRHAGASSSRARPTSRSGRRSRCRPRPSRTRRCRT